jgi:hypothetical protein
LHALFAGNADSNVSFLDHGNIVATVTYTSYSFFGIELDVSSDLSFLFGAASADTNRFGLCCYCEKSCPEIVLSHYFG